jgi:hypothetical protein
MKGKGLHKLYKLSFGVENNQGWYGKLGIDESLLTVVGG